MPFPEEVRNKIRKGVKEYLKSVIEDEWALMADKKESPDALKKLEKLWELIYALKVKDEQKRLWFSQILDVLTQFNSARLERIYTSWDTIGILAWSTVIIGAATIIIFLSFFGTENFLAQLLINSLFVGMLSFMIYVIYSYDDPFNPPQKINPKAYEPELWVF